MRWRDRLGEDVAAAGPHGFAWRRSAAALAGLDGFGSGDKGFADEPEVAVAYPRASRPGVARLRNITPTDIVEIDGIPTTCIGRLVLDCAALGDADLLERAVESAIRKRLITDTGLRELATRRALRGLPTLRTVMGRRPVGAPPTGSDPETLVLQLCRNAGLPVPDRQVPPHPGSRYRIDLAWPRWRIAIEVDGRAWHGHEQFDNDRWRQNGITLTGWLPLRFTWYHVTHMPDRCVEQIRTALRQRGCPTA